MSQTVFKKCLSVILAGGLFAGAVTTASAPAEARGGRKAAIAAGAVGAIALGAAAAAAANNRGPDRVYVDDDPGYGPDCYWRRERVWDGYAYRVQRVQVCE